MRARSAFSGAGGNCGSDFTSRGGGGGGGYYGGGGGGGCGGSGGGGGSSFVVAGATGVYGDAYVGGAGRVDHLCGADSGGFRATASPLHFGSQAVGTAGPAQVLDVVNNGAAPLVVSGVLLGGADPDDFLVGDRCQLPVAPGTFCELWVHF